MGVCCYSRRESPKNHDNEVEKSSLELKKPLLCNIQKCNSDHIRSKTQAQNQKQHHAFAKLNSIDSLIKVKKRSSLKGRLSLAQISSTRKSKSGHLKAITPEPIRSTPFAPSSNSNPPPSFFFSSSKPLPLHNFNKRNSHILAQDIDPLLAEMLQPVEKQTNLMDRHYATRNDLHFTKEQKNRRSSLGSGSNGRNTNQQTNHPSKNKKSKFRNLNNK